MSSNSLSILILAAGKGSRMKSDAPKVMHKIAGREMLNMVLDVAHNLHPQEIVIVASDDLIAVEDKIFSEHEKDKISFALQKERKGTADAVKIGLKQLKKIPKKILILYGDTPLIEEKTLREMLKKLENNSLCVLGFDCFEANAYGRLIVDVNGELEKIVEFKDASSKEKEVSLCNSGVVGVDGDEIENLLNAVKNDNVQGEFYLTDIVGIACENGLKVSYIRTIQDEVLGVNSRMELAKIEKIKQQQLRKKHLDNGVTMLDPKTVHFSFDTKISHDTIIHQNVVFGKNVEIEKNVEIKSFSHIEGAKIKEGAVVGPFARLRPGTVISEDARIGNFVEVKKSLIKKGAKVNHLSYIGDAEIGVEANIGAGTITCNYDGYNKFETKIGDGVFVGSNSALVAPITIGSGAVIGAGSVVVKDVEKDELSISRMNQTNIKDGGKKYHQTKSKNKKKNA